MLARFLSASASKVSGNCMSRTATCGLLLLLFILVVPAFSAGYQILAKGPNPATAESTRVIVGHSTHPAILPPTSHGLSHIPSLSIQTSFNWSGYVVPSGTGSVTEVKGSWIVPSVSCSSSDSFSSFWVGIDGWPPSTTVEQTGTDSDCGGGTPLYYAWYEFYPANESLIGNVPVAAGDVISASVSCQADGLLCTVSITDVSNGQSFSFSQRFSPGSGPRMSSAEWIAEAPYLPSLGTFSPLSDFGTVHFGQDSTGVTPSDSATVNGVTGSIGSFESAVVEVTMVTQEELTLAQPSGLSNDGTSFSVVWGSGPALSSGAVSPGGPTIKVGESVQLTANPSGGSPPYTIAWYSAARAGNCSTSDDFVSTGPTYATSPTLNTYYCYIVTDSASPPSTAVSPTDLVTVILDFTSPAVSVSPGIIGVGQSALISTSTAFGIGAPPYTCQWLEKPPSAANFSDFGGSFTAGCIPSSRPSASTGALPTSGTWAFELEVTDALGSTVVSAGASLSVSAFVGPVLTLTCNPSLVVVGSATICEATVRGSGTAPTGSVAWSSSSPGKLSKASCRLSGGACSVKFTPTAAGASVGLLAGYVGDTRNSPSSGAYILTVNLETSTTTVSCTPAGVPAASSRITCKAKVAGYSPTGAVTWSQAGAGSVSFSAVPTCTLSKGACSVTMTGSAVGALDVNASYSGDSERRCELRGDECDHHQGQDDAEHHLRADVIV